MKRSISFVSHFWLKLSSFSRMFIGLLFVLLVSFIITLVRLDGSKSLTDLFFETVTVIICIAVLGLAFLFILDLVSFAITDIIRSVKYAKLMVVKYSGKNSILLDVVNVLNSNNEDVVGNYIKGHMKKYESKRIHLVHLVSGLYVVLNTVSDDWSVIITDKSTGETRYYNKNGKVNFEVTG